MSVPPYLKIQYKSSMGFSSIHEVAADRNTRIKQFYWQLWFGDKDILPEVDVRATYTAPEVTVDVAAVESSCSAVSNQDESFHSMRTAEVKAPMDFAIVIG